MAVQMVKLILISAFYIGRLDTPLFAPGVGCVGPVPLDAHPIQFRKDLLLHEAHRHPYMERLAVIYILKLRHGDAFGSRAGAAWRLIFTMALMPWLRRYRLDDGPIDGGADCTNEPESALQEDGVNNMTDNPSVRMANGSSYNKDAELERLRNYVKELEAKIKNSDLGQQITEAVTDEFMIGSA